MRARNIKPGFFRNEALGECSIEARMFFIGMWCIADRRGRLQDRPKKIRAEVMPYDLIDAEPLVQQLEQNGLIVRYEVDGEKYIWIRNFWKHQSPHHTEKDSEYPACPCEAEEIPETNVSTPLNNSERTVKEPLYNEEVTDKASLCSPLDSLIPLFPDSLEKEKENGDSDFDLQSEKPNVEKKTKPATQAPDKEQIKAGFQEFMQIYPECPQRRSYFAPRSARDAPSQAQKNWENCVIKRKIPIDTILHAARAYADQCRAKGTPEEFVIFPSNFLGQQQKWADYAGPETIMGRTMQQVNINDFRREDGSIDTVAYTKARRNIAG